MYIKKHTCKNSLLTVNPCLDNLFEEKRELNIIFSSALRFLQYLTDLSYFWYLHVAIKFVDFSIWQFTFHFVLKFLHSKFVLNLKKNAINEYETNLNQSDQNKDVQFWCNKLLVKDSFIINVHIYKKENNKVAQWIRVF